MAESLACLLADLSEHISIAYALESILWLFLAH